MTKVFSILLIGFMGLVLVSSRTNDYKSATDTSFLKKELLDTIQITDGPYIFIKGDSLIEKRIINGKLEIKSSALQSMRSQFDNESSTFTNVSKIAALSDIHGQYNLAKTILQKNGIIDAEENWAYGDGHFVIVGDIFDRGPNVTELLWLIFKLETQAEQAGGKVHYLLGNHEYMVMQNDLRYINRKYKQTERILRTHYYQLYDNETILGKWLRSKATILKIDNYLFVHAGLSLNFLENSENLETVNQKMRESLVEQQTEAAWDSIYNKYYNNKGPIWYRGYFSEEFNNNQLKKILKTLQVDHIVVGHTSQKKIESLFKNKILAIDTSIKNGVSGELLFIENGEFYRGTMDGKKIKIKK